MKPNGSVAGSVAVRVGTYATNPEPMPIPPQRAIYASVPTHEVVHQLREVSLQEMYSREVRPDLHLGLELLDTAIARFEAAHHLYMTEEYIASDDEVQHGQALMPRLFCCRSLGDGFGAIIDAIQTALENQAGVPLTVEQIDAIAAALKRVRAAPFIALVAVLDYIDALEEADLVTVAPELAVLAEPEKEP